MSQGTNVTSLQPEKLGFKEILVRIGPGLIMAASCIGPGSITTAIVNGSTYGYSLLWVVALALIIRATFSRSLFVSSLVLEEPFMGLVRRFYGPVFAIIMACTSFFSGIAFQTGNFAGTGMGASIIFPFLDWKIWGAIMTAFAVWMVFNKKVYSFVEIFMKVLVFAMVLSFLAILLAAGGASPVKVVEGLVPSFPEGSFITVLAILGSNASLSGMVYGTYLIREKKWTKADIRNRVVNSDIIVSVCSVGIILLMLTLIGITVLRPAGIAMTSIQDLIGAVTPIVEPIGKYIVAVGYFSAAVSSMIANAQCVSFLFMGGIGRKAEMTSKEVRLLSAGLLIFGCIVGFIIGRNPVPLIVIAQAASVVEMPLLGLFGLLISRRAELGEYKAGPVLTTAQTVGYILYIAITIKNIINFF